MLSTAVVAVVKPYVPEHVTMHVKEVQNQLGVVIVLRRATILAMVLLLPHHVRLVVTVVIWLVHNHAIIRAELPVLTLV